MARYLLDQEGGNVTISSYSDRMIIILIIINWKMNEIEKFI